MPVVQEGGYGAAYSAFESHVKILGILDYGMYEYMTRLGDLDCNRLPYLKCLFHHCLIGRPFFFNRNTLTTAMAPMGNCRLPLEGWFACSHHSRKYTAMGYFNFLEIQCKLTKSSNQCTLNTIHSSPRVSNTRNNSTLMILVVQQKQGRPGINS